MIVCGIVAAFMGVKYSIFQYIANSLLLYSCMGFSATIGTLWTLLVELIFYCIVLHFAKLDFKNIIIIDSVILLFVSAQAITKGGSFVLMYSLKFVPIILFGSAMYELHNVTGAKKYVEFVIIAAMTYFIPYISITYIYTDAMYYKNPASYIFALGIWALFLLLHKLGVRFVQESNTIINFIVSTSYFLYLLQLNVGFVVMYCLRQMGVGAYINILCGIGATFIVSAIFHYLCEKPIQKFLEAKLCVKYHEFIYYGNIKKGEDF